MQAPWLAILGIGEDGVEGLSPAASALLGGARLVVGGRRHLALVRPILDDSRAETLSWPNPVTDAFPAILEWRGEPVAVLSSGDPFCYGIGSLLARVISPREMLCLPAASAFSLAAARLGWALQDTAQISFCGRPLAPLAPLLQPGSRILALSTDESTPDAVAHFLCERGFGPSRLHVMEALGGPRERIRSCLAGAFDIAAPDRLNLVAIEAVAGPGAHIIPLASGLPDGAFAHDGQITKREIRALTLAALAPRRGELLWDIGCGAGSVAIEWMLRSPANRAVGIEQDGARAARAACNAAALGVPGLTVVTGHAPEALCGLPAPNAVFIGGGAQDRHLLDGAWAALSPGGRLVVNAVTIETEAVLLDAYGSLGGELTRLSVQRAAAIGSRRGFRPAMTVTQWAAQKP